MDQLACGASHDRNVEAALPQPGFAVVEARFAVDELIRFIRATPERAGVSTLEP